MMVGDGVSSAPVGVMYLAMLHLQRLAEATLDASAPLPEGEGRTALMGGLPPSSNVILRG